MREVIKETSRQKWTHRSTILEESPNTILRVVRAEKDKKVKKRFGHLIPYNMGFEFFQ